MSINPDALTAILMMGVASHFCRVIGFFLMRYVAITPRVDAWLRALPIAHGRDPRSSRRERRPAEWTGLAVSIGLMRATGSDFLSVLTAVIAVASVRAIGL